MEMLRPNFEKRMVMKHIFLKTFLLISSYLLLMTGSFYLSYRNAYKDYSKRIEKQYVNNKQDTKNNDSIAVNRISETILKRKTDLYLESYKMDTGETTVEKLPLPSRLVGMRRMDVEHYLKNYMEDIPLDEKEKGLIAYELTYFSEGRIILKKTYENSLQNHAYYLTFDKQEVTVFYPDQKTIYSHTGIFKDTLTKDEIKELKQGIHISNEETLYSVLESYSS